MPVIIDQITATVVQPESTGGDQPQKSAPPMANIDPLRHRETLYLLREREARVKAD